MTEGNPAEEISGRYALRRDRRGDRSETEIRCPICLDKVPWDDRGLFVRSATGTYEPVEPTRGDDDLKTGIEFEDAVRLCPNPSRNATEHYLPMAYAQYGPPLVIGFVGETRSGKSHLLSSIVNSLTVEHLHRFAFDATPVDDSLHNAFKQKLVDPMFRYNQTVPRTETVGPAAQVNFVDSMLVGNSVRGKRAVTFFDVSGEDLTKKSRSMNFIFAVDALVFVVDPDKALQPGAAAESDESFDMVIRRLQKVGKRIEDMPVSVVLAKADKYRFEPPVSMWLRRQDLSAYRRSDGLPDPHEIYRESQDVFAFLSSRGAGKWLSPVETFRRSTLHFVSSTGSDSVLDTDRGGRHGGVWTFPRGVRPRRVLEPVAAIFAMSGMLGRRAAAEVGV